MREKLKYKNKCISRLVVSLMLTLIISSGISLKTYAAPKQMPDGNLFDAQFYAETYPDIAAVLGTDETVLYNHYVLCGSLEGRIPYQLSKQEIRNKEIYNKIMALKEIYPQGMKWDESNTYEVKAYAHAKPSNWILTNTGKPYVEANRENGYTGWVVTACQAFAYTVQDTVFGTGIKIKDRHTGLQDWAMQNAGGSIYSGDEGWVPTGYYGQDAGVNARFEEYWDKIRPGDAIADGMHIVVVLTKSDDRVTVVEGNYNGTVNWGRVIHKRDLKLSLYRVETPSW